MSNRIFQFLVFSILTVPLLSASFLQPGLVAAQEGGGQPFSTTAGPYDITVSGFPSGLSLGKARFVVTVVDAATGRPVPDAQVVLFTEHRQDGIEGWGLALQDPQALDRYIAEINLTEAGIWDISVGVNSPQGQVEVEAPPVEVPAEQQYTSGSLVFFGMFLFIIFGGAFVVWRIRRTQRQRQAGHAG